jgi:putative SOS response-associated peptidase YedK
LESCTVLTIAANALMSPIHDRMPVIIDPAHYAEWLSPDTATARARDLMQPWAATDMLAYRVSTRVNTPAHDDAACVAPLADDASG